MGSSQAELVSAMLRGGRRDGEIVRVERCKLELFSVLGDQRSRCGADPYVCVRVEFEHGHAVEAEFEALDELVARTKIDEPIGG
jgi:hypothetical protein